MEPAPSEPGWRRCWAGGGMADEENNEEQEQKLFTLTEAERTRRELEPVLIEAIEVRRKMAPLDEELSGIAARIQWTGGMVVAYEKAARLRFEHDRLAESLKSAVEKIQATGCVVKDLDIGLLDFPALINDEEVYLCWRLGEERIRFWHRQDEGFSGRKPIDPGDDGTQNPIQ
jgi:hypothetical protein